MFKITRKQTYSNQKIDKKQDATLIGLPYEMFDEITLYLYVVHRHREELTFDPF